MFEFVLNNTDGYARSGLIKTDHGEISTPVFMPVGTQGSIKALSPQDLYDIGVQIILGNAYHLYLRPGTDILEEVGGLHQFMQWGRPILTDSGGFQGFSLKHLRHITEDGITFKSHIDGSTHLLTPEKVISIQGSIGSDILMPLDVCVPPESDYKDTLYALKLTNRWMNRSVKSHIDMESALFGIVQGGVFPELRKQSVECVIDLDLPGYSIGGLSVGESKSELYDLTEMTAQLLPNHKPRYLMGVGSPEDLVVAVSKGVDMFDCVLPTRVARNGALFTRKGRVNITNNFYRTLDDTFDKTCKCYFCNNFTAAYLHHLFRCKEYLAYRLASIHNLAFITSLMNDIRNSIEHKSFAQFSNSFLSQYKIAG
jgi:queuine tRNA-ribosyltransferase